MRWWTCRNCVLWKVGKEVSISAFIWTHKSNALAVWANRLSTRMNFRSTAVILAGFVNGCCAYWAEMLSLFCMNALSCVDTFPYVHTLSCAKAYSWVLVSYLGLKRLACVHCPVCVYVVLCTYIVLCLYVVLCAYIVLCVYVCTLSFVNILSCVCVCVCVHCPLCIYCPVCIRCPLYIHFPCKGLTSLLIPLSWFQITRHCELEPC